MTFNQPKDSYVRDEVIDPSRSFVVSAPAGSGKTGLLTFRVLKLLCIVNKPEEILAITFTRKAASEMRERIFGWLDKASSPDSLINLEDMSDYDKSLFTTAKQAVKRDEQLGWALLSNRSQLNIATIDGFCKGICNQLPFFSAIGSTTSVIDNPSSEYDLVTRRWIFDELKEKKNEHISALIEHFSGNIERLVSLFSELLSVRDQWLPLVSIDSDSDALKHYFEQTLQEWVYQSIEGICPYLNTYEGELFQHISYALSHIEEAKDPSLIKELSSFSSLPNWTPRSEVFWRNLAKFCLTKDKNGYKYRQRLDKNLGFPAFKDKQENAEAKKIKASVLNMFSELSESGLSANLLSEMLFLPNTHYNDDQWRILEALLSVLPKLAAYLKLRFSELGQADFNEFSLGAVRALDHEMGDIDLQQRLDYRIQHVLIDEFQDTSQTQLDLLKAITKEWIPNDGKTLFLVGDGMQSCYSFRNANVGIFLTMRHLGLSNIDLNPRDLTVNFRSDKCLVDWVNQAFEPVFPSEDNANSGAVKYIPSVAFNDTGKNSYVSSRAYAKGTLLEAEGISNEVKHLLNTYPEDSIAVLARSRSHLSQVIKAFEENDIDYLATDFDPLISKQHITDIHSLSQAIFDFGNKLAFLALLRSPFCALDHADLFQVFNAETKEEKNPTSVLTLIERSLSSKSLSKNGLLRLSRFYSTISDVKKYLNRRSFSECVEITWLKLGGAESLESEAEIDDIQNYLTLLRKYELASSIKNWSDLELALEKEFATPSTRTSNPVHIMTMHKSKGLEFDTVFLPSLDKRKRSDDSDILYWLEKLDQNLQSQFILSPISAPNKGIDNQITKYIKSLKSEKSGYEDSRIFYVACTRSKKRLYLSANFEFDELGDIKPAEKSALISKVWTNIKDTIEVHNTDHQIKENPNKQSLRTVTSSSPKIKALPIDWHFEQEGFSDISSTITFDNSDYDFYQCWSDQNSVNKSFGIVIHSLLQHCSETGIETFAGMGSDRLNALIEFHLRKEGVSTHTMVSASSEIFDVFQKLLSDPHLHWILSSSHTSSQNEWSLWHRHHGVSKESIIDRSFIDGSTRWVIDYKSTRPSPNQSLQVFLEEQKSSYKDQLLRYRSAVAGFDKHHIENNTVKDIKLGLYFPRLLCFVHCDEWDLEY